MKRWMISLGVALALVLTVALIALGPPKHPPDPKAECSQKARSFLELTACDPVRMNQQWEQSQKELQLESRIQAFENQQRDRLLPLRHKSTTHMRPAEVGPRTRTRRPARLIAPAANLDAVLSLCKGI